MYSEIVSLKSSTYEPSPESREQIRDCTEHLEKLSYINEDIFSSRSELKEKTDNELLNIARRLEQIRARAQSLTRFANGRLNAILSEMKERSE